MSHLLGLLSKDPVALKALEERVKKALQVKNVPEETKKTFDKFEEMKRELEELSKEVESIENQIYGDRTKIEERAKGKCPKR